MKRNIPKIHFIKHKSVLVYQTDNRLKLKYLLFWEKGFSKTGIRSFIIDDVIEFLNQKVKENLEVLSNGTTSLIFEPENKGKTTGVVSNNIITKLFVNGRERLLKLHSGGEAERYTIAVELALSDLAESRSGTKFNIRFLDEPFTAFDTKPQLKSFALFNKAAGEKQGFFIISHNKEFQQYCDNSIYVVKQDGVSRLVDQATFINIGENL
jgi:DNA repair exonuclease SbcCD ATPase subunit